MSETEHNELNMIMRQTAYDYWYHKKAIFEGKPRLRLLRNILIWFRFIFFTINYAVLCGYS